MGWGPVKPALVKKLISLLDISGAEADKTKGRIEEVLHIGLGEPLAARTLPRNEKIDNIWFFRHFIFFVH